MTHKWTPESREEFWTFADEPDDPVQSLHWGAKPEHDAELLRNGRVFRTKAEAQQARTDLLRQRNKAKRIRGF